MTRGRQGVPPGEQVRLGRDAQVAIDDGSPKIHSSVPGLDHISVGCPGGVELLDSKGEKPPLLLCKDGGALPSGLAVQLPGILRGPSGILGIEGGAGFICFFAAAVHVRRGFVD